MGSSLPKALAASEVSRAEVMYILGVSYGVDPLAVPANITDLLLSKGLVKFTYRCHLPPLDSFDTDVGWGCMHRSIQMLIAHVLIYKLENLSPSKPAFTQLLSQFLDVPDGMQPFSLHSICRYAREFCLKEPGDWLGPYSAARIIKAALAATRPRLEVAIGGDNGIISETQVDKAWAQIACQSKVPSNDPDDAVLLLIPRLLTNRRGKDLILGHYKNDLKWVLQQKCCGGILGGSDHYRAMYIAGYSIQNDGDPVSLLCLDPHSVRCAITSSETLSDKPKNAIRAIEAEFLRQSTIDSLCDLDYFSINELNPNICICLVFKTHQEWDVFSHSLLTRNNMTASERAGAAPLLEFHKKDMERKLKRLEASKKDELVDGFSLM